MKEPTAEDCRRIAKEVLGLVDSNLMGNMLHGLPLSSPDKHHLLDARLGEILATIDQHHDATIAMYLRASNPRLSGAVMPNWKLLFEAGWARATEEMRNDAYFGLYHCYEESYLA